MTNDEIRIECLTRRFYFGSSGFGIISSFDIRHSEFLSAS